MALRPSIFIHQVFAPAIAVLAGLPLVAAAQSSNDTLPAVTFPAVPLASPSNLSNTQFAKPANAAAAAAAWEWYTGSNAMVRSKSGRHAEDFGLRLQSARHLRLARMFTEATSAYTNLLESAAPQQIKRNAMIELAQMAQDQNDPARAQQIYAQALLRWPEDQEVPELLLRQGLAYKQMGLINLAVTKFYAVMTSAMTLKPDSFDYYQQLVLRAQMEIAETQFEQGNYSDAIDCFARLLKLEVPPVDRSTIAHRYVLCLQALGRCDEAIVQARDFLEKYPEAPERAEVRFICATALKQRSRDAEAVHEVLALLQEQQVQGTNAAPDLAYWQHRAGNEIANQFYRQGDPMKALDIYITLANLDNSAEWQLPVWYQVGLVFERLNQTVKAVEYYGKIARREPELSADAPPSLKAVVEMAKWRADFLGWRLKAESASLQLREVTQPTAVSMP